MTKKILILGAGGFGRELLSWTRDWLGGRDGWTLAGFLDDNLQGSRPDGLPPILGPISGYQPAAHEVFLCGIGLPKAKLAVCEQIKARGGQFLTLVHPSAVVGERVILGEGTVICPRVVLTCDISVGAFVTINAAATVGHDAVLGDGVTLSGHCDVTGHVKLGRGVFFGSHATAIPSVKIGDFAVVGAGSTVVRSVKPGATVFGVPAKQISGFSS